MIDQCKANLEGRTIVNSYLQTNPILDAQARLRKLNVVAIHTMSHVLLEPKKSEAGHRIDHLFLSIQVSRISKQFIVLMTSIYILCY